MKKEIVCQDNRLPYLYILHRCGGKGESERNFALTSLHKFSINVYIYCHKGIIPHEEVSGDLSPLRQKR